MNNTFIHLNVHSELSIVDSIVRLDALCQKAAAHQMPAVAVTDVCNLFATVKFFRKAISKGIQPIIGAEIWLESAVKNYDHSKIIFLCQNAEGYHNLTKLISRCYLEGKRLKLPLAKYKWIREYTKGLIAISDPVNSDFSQLILQGNLEKAEKCVQTWMSWFADRFYIGLSRFDKNLSAQLEKPTLNICEKLNIPIVALNSVVFVEPTEYEAHEARVCIQEGTVLENPERTTYHKAQYFQSSEQMIALFSDLPSAIENTVQIAKRCSFFLEFGDPALPSFPVPEGDTEESYIESASQKGLKKRLDIKFTANDYSDDDKQKLIKEYDDRLALELAVINKMGFPGYFLIVSDFIQWAKSEDIPVGPGRGSGAGSLVAYALEITDIDPIDYELLFERFLNPERVSMPDFDIDFCMDNRDRVIEYVADRYGRDCVSQIATFGTMAAKAVIRDVGRVLSHPYGFVDQIAKLIPFEIGMTLTKALEQEPALQERYDDDEEVKALIDLAKQLEGITRNVGKHAGGVVIAPSKLSDFAPLYCEENSTQAVTQFDKDDAETVGLVKFDFLGLRTLTIIHWATQNANQQRAKNNQTPIDINLLPIDDAKTFQLLKETNTTAVFQLESHGMKELIKRLKPDLFEEIIALVALFRPGPLQSGMVDDFIERKHGLSQVVYPHEKIAPILKPTYGVILYQEQVMQIAQVLAGYSLGQADLLRRAMGKKKVEEMAEQRAAFVSGSVERDVDQKTAESIFDLMEKFAGYGFNKSHSAAYALVAYQTAWLKAHYPSCYMAAVLSADLSHTDKIVKLIDDCLEHKIKVIAPNINTCDYHFTVGANNEILYGLGAIKGAGEAAIENIIEMRSEGPYKNLFELCQRIDLRKVTKRVLEPLIKAGAFDSFGEDRGILLANLLDAMKGAEQFKKDQSMGQGDLFGAVESAQPDYKRTPESLLTSGTRLKYEKESLGLYFSGHPMEEVADELKAMGTQKLRTMMSVRKERKVSIAGLILQVRTMQTKKGDRIAFILLDDQSMRFEVAVFSDAYQKYRDLLVKDKLVVISSKVSYDTTRQSIKIQAVDILSLADARASKVKCMKLKIKSSDLKNGHIEALKLILEREPKGNCPIYIEYCIEKAKALLKFDEMWDLQVSKGTINKIKEKIPKLEVEVLY
tara:strand:+ start:166223 stop:169684 length:3462 start_codon:yes stop_codon:yes gene_type:complete